MFLTKQIKYIIFKFLADLSRLIPSSYTKKGRGRIEKTEIIEMAIKHMRHLQHHPCQANGEFQIKL